VKKIFVCVAIVFAVTVSNAKANELCEAQSNLASTIMDARQNGMPMLDMMKAVGPDAPLAKILVRAAYDSPRYHSEEMRTYATTEFSNEVYLMCVEATED
jgi:hypothetical protein